MAIIKNIISGEIIHLNSQHRFGRSQQTVHTTIPETDVSQSHAIITWRSNNWYLQDHSRNGTFVSGEYVNNETVKLSKGGIIRFGNNDSTQWEILNLNPPTCYLKSQDSQTGIIELNSFHAFPNEENPQEYLYSENGIWKLEVDGEVIDLKHNSTYSIDNKKYTYIENNVLEDTMDNGHLTRNAYFKFLLSSDEEHIHLKLITNNQELDLGERVHNYLLLTLVRKRLEDVQLNRTANDQGWVSIDDVLYDISKEFNKEVDAYYLNLTIFRIRKLLMDTKPHGYLFSNIIQRRSGEIRFAYQYFQILKEQKCVGEVLAMSN